MCMNRFHSVAVSIHSRWIVNISFWFLRWSFIIDDDGGAGFPLRRDYGRMDITLSPLVKTMNDAEAKFTLPSSTYIISPLPLFYSPVITIPLCWPWTCTCTHIRSFFSFMVSFVFSRLSLPVSVMLSPTSHLSVPPSFSAMDSGEPISSRSCLLFATVNSASLENGPLSSSRAFSFGQLGSFALTLKLLLGGCEKGGALAWYGASSFHAGLTPSPSGNGFVWLKPRLTEDYWLWKHH